jgi:hypothetical protein
MTHVAELVGAKGRDGREYVYIEAPNGSGRAKALTLVKAVKSERIRS